MSQFGLFDLDERLAKLSEKGDRLEELGSVVDFEQFRRLLEQAVHRADRSRGGRPAFDHVLMFKILILQAHNSLSYELCEFYIRDRLTWMRFLGLGLSDRVPDANTIRDFHEALTKAAVMQKLFDQFDTCLQSRGYVAMSGQLVDASIIKAPRQRNSQEEKDAIKAGKLASEIWANPAKAAQKDTDARWTVKYSKAKVREDGHRLVDLAVPEFGYKDHISIDNRFGFIRKWVITPASSHDGAQLENLIDISNTATAVYADTAYRSARNEMMLAENKLTSHIHHKKPKGGPMPEHIICANRSASRIRAKVEHVFAELKDRMGLIIRTIGITRAQTRIGLANLVYNMKRLRFWEKQMTVA